MSDKKKVYRHHFDVDSVIAETGIAHRDGELRKACLGAYRQILPISSQPVMFEHNRQWLEEMREREWPGRHPEGASS